MKYNTHDVMHPGHYFNCSEQEKLDKFLAESGLVRADVRDWTWMSGVGVNLGLGRRDRHKVKSEGIEIPYYTIDGEPVLDCGVPFKRYRLLTPTPGGPKYLSREMTGSHAYIPQNLKALIERAEGKTLVICEGEKKAERLVKLGIAAIAIAGVQMWADSKVRDQEKRAAERNGLPAPKLNRKTPVSEDIRKLIRDFAITKAIILFDSDGLPVDLDAPGVTRDFKPAIDGQVCLNPDVFWAAKKFAAAMLRSCPGVEVAYGFAPHAVDGEGHLTRQGIDDWSLAASVDEVKTFIGELANQARMMTPEQLEAEEKRAADALRRAYIEKNQGFVPLGFSTSEGTTTLHIWSKAQQSVQKFTAASLMRKSDYMMALGTEYCTEFLGKDVVVQKGDEQRGIPEITTRKFDLDIAMSVITESCMAAGRWSAGASLRGGGIWSDAETGGLIINSFDGIRLITPDGRVSVTDRVRGRFIYVSTEHGKWTDDKATVEDVIKIVDIIENSWEWTRKSDAILFAGWLLAQAYTGALKARPGVMLHGESGCGKSYLEEWSKTLIGRWGIRIEDTRGSTIAGLSQTIKRDSLTLILDEVEPKSGGSLEEAARINRGIEAIRQMLRASYSRSDDPGSYASVKGTVSQEATAREVRVMAMIASIAEHDLEQADRNRNLRLGLKRIPVDENGKPSRRPPALPGEGEGLSLFALMWSRWATFQANLDAIEQMIVHREARMRLTLAVPLAALITGLGKNAEEAKKLVDLINDDYSAADDDAPRDQDRALQRLLAAVIDVNGVKRTIAAAVLGAFDAGLGRRGPKPGGADGVSLRMNGLTARRNSDGTISLFVADGHHKVEEIGRQIGYPNLPSLLRAIEGAEAAARTKTGDNRAKFDGSLWRGTWVPTSLHFVAAIESDEDGDGADAEAMPY